jgi:uncharacterized protein (TIGR02246 family)
MSRLAVLVVSVGLALPGPAISEDARSKAVESAIQGWTEGWRTKNAQLACASYADDADWTNAFGMTERGRDAICKRLAEVFTLPFVMAATSDVVSQDIRFLGSDVAVVITTIRRTGQQTPAGEPLGDRDTRHQRVLFRSETSGGSLATS